MKPFIWLDAKILGAVERLSHAIQRTFGIGCQRSAILCYGAFIALIAKEDILTPMLVGKHPDWMAVIAMPLFLGVYLIGMPWSANHYENINAKGFSNPRKIMTSAVVFRLVFLGACGLLLAISLSGNLSMLPLCLSSYFEACDDLPPGQSRVCRWLNNIAAFGRKPVEVQTNA